MSPLRRPRLAAALALVLAAAAGMAGAAPPARAEAEIRALIEAVGQSGCRFQRNGRWHEPAQAQAHLQRKYDWARRRGLEGSAEDFIERAASRSSFSGRPYRIACPGQGEVEATAWFSARLARLRAAHAPAR